MNVQTNQFVAGHFLAAWASVTVGSTTTSWSTIGSTESGWTIEKTIHKDDITDDRIPGVPFDDVDIGTSYAWSGVMLNINVVESSGMLYSSNAQGHSADTVGQLGSMIYGSLCLTPAAGSLAANLIGAGKSYVAFLCGLANNTSWIGENKHRKIPCSFKLLPDPNNGLQAYGVINTPAGVPAAYP